MGKDTKKDIKQEEKILNKAIREITLHSALHMINKIKEENLEHIIDFIGYLNRTTGLLESYAIHIENEQLVLAQLINIMNDCLDILSIGKTLATEKDMRTNSNIRAILKKRLNYYKEQNIGVTDIVSMDYYIILLFNDLELRKHFLSSLTEDKRQEYDKCFTYEMKELDYSILAFNTFYFVSMINFKNKNIKDIKVNGAEWKIVYGFDEILQTKDFKYGGSMTWIDTLYDNKIFNSFLEYILTLPEVIFNKTRVEKHNKEVPEQYKIDNSYYFEINEKAKEAKFPFVNFSLSDISDVSYYLDIDKILDLKNNKRYCIPTDGAIIDFIDKNNGVDYVSIIEKDNKFCFSIKYTDTNIIKTSKMTNFNQEKDIQIINVLYKETIETFFYHLENMKKNNKTINILDCMRLIPYAEGNHEFRGTMSALEKAEIFILALKHFVLTCLYILYVDMNLNGVKVYSQRFVEREGKVITEREATYRTAHIRKLPAGWTASEEAKSEAKKVHVMLPKGYTFVREHIPSEDKSVRVVKV